MISKEERAQLFREKVAKFKATDSPMAEETAKIKRKYHIKEDCPLCAGRGTVGYNRVQCCWERCSCLKSKKTAVDLTAQK